MRTRAEWEWDCLYGKGMEQPKKETTEEDETEEDETETGNK